MTKETIGGIMSEEIKSCPFCGREGHLKEGKAMVWVVVCSGGIKCPVQPIAHSDLNSDAVTRWNKRPDNWISIKERLPKVEQIVLWWNSDVGMVEFGSSYSFNGENVTHWMPLPKLPTNQTQGT